MPENAVISFEDVEQKRRAFSKALLEFRRGGGRYHNPAAELPPSKLEGCEVLNNRYSLIDRIMKNGKIAEIGVDRGDFSFELLTRCAPKKLHLFDIDISRLDNPNILKELSNGSDQVLTHVGDSSSNMMKMPDSYFDAIYIDGDHRYEGVKRDIEASLPKLNRDGVIIFNDYAVWSATSMFHCGVARAVHELCLTNPWKFRYIALQPMMYNDVMLVRE